MNYWRILGIAGAAFCTSGIPAMALLGLNQKAFLIALATAAFNGALAGFQEIQKESENADVPGVPAVLGGVFLL